MTAAGRDALRNNGAAGVLANMNHLGSGVRLLTVVGQSSQESDILFHVDKFIEKPNLKDAKKYLLSKDFYWNAGMFLFTEKVFPARANMDNADNSTI